MNIIINIVNFIVIFSFSFLLGTKNIFKNIFYSFLISSLLTLEVVSFFYFGREVDEQFLFFLSNINIFHLAIDTEILILYYGTLFFIFSWWFIYFIIKKQIIKKYKKIIASIFIILLFNPYGFFYSIIRSLTVDYVLSYYSYRNYSYNDIYKKIYGKDYIIKDKIKILNSEQKRKNLVLIYLESYEQELLTNNKLKKYTKNLNKLAQKNEFYKNIEQLPSTNGTMPGMFATQCGSQYSSFNLFFNPYGKTYKNLQFVCFPDVLKKDGYTEIFIGGANKRLFNKGNLLFSHGYDKVYDETSLIEKYPEFKYTKVDWGIADIDIFKAAKDEYIELSKSNKPFNLTLLTSSTHNISGEYDKRCPNTSDGKLLNAIECTDYIVNDFINFLKKQKNYKNTIIVILPDHKQYQENQIKDILENYDKRKLDIIIINSGSNVKHNGDTYYTDLAKIILDKLNVKSNAVFLGKQENLKITQNFIHKIHRESK